MLMMMLVLVLLARVTELMLSTPQCYHTDHTDANNTKNYGCNSYPNCNWRGHFSNYHLTTAQMESPVVSMIDYELHQAPINPSMTKALKLTNKPPWNEHSVRATKEPFARKNEPWNSNFSDFVASSDEARKVGHVPLPVHQIGLGSFFDRGFDRRLVGRRNLFREGGASLGGASPPKVHFEDMDRVRGLTVSASLVSENRPDTGGELSTTTCHVHSAPQTDLLASPRGSSPPPSSTWAPRPGPSGGTSCSTRRSCGAEAAAMCRSWCARRPTRKAAVVPFLTRSRRRRRL